MSASGAKEVACASEPNHVAAAAAPEHEQTTELAGLAQETPVIQPTPAAAPEPAETVELVGLAEDVPVIQSTPAPKTNIWAKFQNTNTWRCSACMVENDNTSAICAACTTARDGSRAPVKLASKPAALAPTGSGFKFGGSAAAPVVTATSGGGFKFGAAATTPAPTGSGFKFGGSAAAPVTGIAPPGEAISG